MSNLNGGLQDAIDNLIQVVQQERPAKALPLPAVVLLQCCRGLVDAMM